MSTLTPRQSEALRLRDSGMRYSEIAERMGVTRPAVSMLLTRARRTLGLTVRAWRLPPPLTAAQHAYLAEFESDMRTNRWKSPQSRELLDLLLAEAGVERSHLQETA